jgi:hypothetical protein
VAWLFVAFAGCSALACKTEEPTRKSSPAFAPAPDPNAPPPREVLEAQKPWTERFQTAGVLIADEVRIEGPAPLLEHVVTRPETGVHDVEVKTIPAGFQQTITVRVGGAEIRAQIDAVAISAMRRIVVLERPGLGDVLVTATGNVFWKEPQADQPTRTHSLRLEGPIAR